MLNKTWKQISTKIFQPFFWKTFLRFLFKPYRVPVFPLFSPSHPSPPCLKPSHPSLPHASSPCLKPSPCSSPCLKPMPSPCLKPMPQAHPSLPQPSLSPMPQVQPSLFPLLRPYSKVPVSPYFTLLTLRFPETDPYFVLHYIISTLFRLIYL